MGCFAFWLGSVVYTKSLAGSSLLVPNDIACVGSSIDCSEFGQTRSVPLWVGNTEANSSPINRASSAYSTLSLLKTAVRIPEVLRIHRQSLGEMANPFHVQAFSEALCRTPNPSTFHRDLSVVFRTAASNPMRHSEKVLSACATVASHCCATMAVVEVLCMFRA
jgi:hypothetical protein